tara:strand:+ start:1906 stop:2142 length:237 start_codon:yes stop_codon:yes gene_type:complete
VQYIKTIKNCLKIDILHLKIKKMNKEYKKIKIWISDWQEKNTYKKNNRFEQNKKFNLEFSNFLKNESFSSNTIKLFTS